MTFAKSITVLSLILSLLFAPGARSAGTACKPKACAKPCCAAMVCCAKDAREIPAQAPAIQGAGVEAAVLAARTIIVLRVLPAPSRVLFACDEAASIHGLPPLAASCIRLI